MFHLDRNFFQVAHYWTIPYRNDEGGKHIEALLQRFGKLVEPLNSYHALKFSLKTFSEKEKNASDTKQDHEQAAKENGIDRIV